MANVMTDIVWLYMSQVERTQLALGHCCSDVLRSLKASHVDVSTHIWLRWRSRGSKHAHHVEITRLKTIASLPHVSHTSSLNAAPPSRVQT
eukprot:964375-Rhodomonas_salina.3